jgi:hypothetical protein
MGVTPMAMTPTSYPTALEFEALWNRHRDFALPPRRVSQCVYAEKYGEWLRGALAPLLARPTAAALVQAKVVLIDSYMSWRSGVPAQHRNRVGARGHPCLYHVLCDAYSQLKVAELALAPESVGAPPTAPAHGIYLGDEDDDPQTGG